MSTSFFRSSIGRKVIVAVTGLLLIGFLLGHLAGNLQVFAGPDTINAYAAWLQGLGSLLWVVRIGLIVVFVVHLSLALQLKRENMSARPEAYRSENTVQASYSSRVMALSGSIILLFVIGHLLHFTLGILQPEVFHFVDEKGRHDVYRMIVAGFQNQVASGLYIVALLLLWSHLSHGFSSVFQSLGARSRANAKVIDSLGPVLSSVVILGYISIPLSILTGVVR